MDKDKSSRRSTTSDHRDSTTSDHRDRDHKHRSRDKDRYSDHHRSDRDTRDKHKSSSRRDEREGSRDRNREPRDHRDRRERSYDDSRDEKLGFEDGVREVKREDEFEIEGGRKRKERGSSEDRGVNDRDKRSRVSEKRERRRFGDKAKFDEDVDNRVNSSVVNVKEEGYDGVSGGSNVNGGRTTENGATLESFTKTLSTLHENTMASSRPLPTKVSSISNTNENKGVSITRSHEVPGKSSTDGTSSAAGKSGSLSLDALAKAKKALQRQKEVSEKMKKIPLLSKGPDSTSHKKAPAVVKEEVKMPYSGSGGVPSTSTTAISSGVVTSSAAVEKQAASAMAPFSGLASITNIEAVKRAQELAAKMGFRDDREFSHLVNLFSMQTPAEGSVAQKPTKVPVLRIDALGREIDEHGNVISVSKPSNLSTLKVNINKQKKDAFQILKPELEVDPDSNPHFDARMGINKTKLLRPKRMNFQFVEEGRWAKEAEMMKFRSQFGEERAKDIKARQALHAKAKAAPDINPNLIEVSERVIIKEKPKEAIPDIEWWDAPLLPGCTYNEIDDVNLHDKLKMEKMTFYVEHPQPIEPPAEPAPPPPQPLKLTKKEQKKLRTQRRLAREKDKQEMIRQGVIEPPKPKVKMSNLMKVLGAEATQDPTRLEKEIRSAAAEREQAHIDRNIARKLTPAERREKKERKLFDDQSTLETIVSIYKINSLKHKKTRFKVDVNAQENRLTGCAVISDGINVVVVEGGSKAIKRYGKLMLKRINWAEAVEEEEDDEDESEEKPPNKCVLVWQGSVARHSFHRFSVHDCVTDAAARKVFADAGVGHYWDLAINFSDDQM
ncbi:U4/U6 small nuclear ribonucleoprotein Prp3 [Euphorbia peplus]|nr:U4/U6 small nuclear ribonucleoprotein Prp3 [Euphorbia peplus]